jgi:hypothetical protein
LRRNRKLRPLLNLPRQQRALPSSSTVFATLSPPVSNPPYKRSRHPAERRTRDQPELCRQSSCRRRHTIPPHNPGLLIRSRQGAVDARQIILRHTPRWLSSGWLQHGAAIRCIRFAHCLSARPRAPRDQRPPRSPPSGPLISGRPKARSLRGDDTDASVIYRIVIAAGTAFKSGAPVVGTRAAGAQESRQNRPGETGR